MAIAVTDVVRTSDGLLLDFASDDLGHPEMPDLRTELAETVWHRCTAENRLIACRMYGHAMYLKLHGGRLVVRHLNPQHDQVDHGKGPEHEAVQERICRMAHERGLEAYAESSRGADGQTHAGRISDVLICGERTVGFESAYTDSALAVVRKFNRANRDGVTAYFGGPRERSAAANFVDRVPHGVYNDIPALEIAHGRPMPIISGLRRLRRWRCAQEPLWCPSFGKPTRCARTWHSGYLDPEGQVDQDDVVYNLAIGLWTPVKLPTARGASTWQIVPTATIEDYLTDGGILLEDGVRPIGPARSPRTATPLANVECRYAAPDRASVPTPGRRCNWSCCGVADGLRLYAGGSRCPAHTPAAIKGVPEPYELLAIVKANRARFEHGESGA